jgi:hypothetical protein
MGLKTKHMQYIYIDYKNEGYLCSYVKQAAPVNAVEEMGTTV